MPHPPDIGPPMRPTVLQLRVKTGPSCLQGQSVGHNTPALRGDISKDLSTTLLLAQPSFTQHICQIA